MRGKRFGHSRGEVLLQYWLIVDILTVTVAAPVTLCLHGIDRDTIVNGERGATSSKGVCGEGGRRFDLARQTGAKVEVKVLGREVERLPAFPVAEER